MAAFSDFNDLARADLLGCPKPVLERTANRVVRDFCQKTHVWQDWIEEWMMDDLDTYTLQVPSDQEIVAVRYLWKDGTTINGASGIAPSYDHGNEDAGLGSGFVFIPPDTVQLLSMPGSEQQFFARVAYQPTTSASEFPDWIYSHYEDGLLSGIKARLMLQPKVDWSNPELGTYHKRQYKGEIARARRQMLKQHTAGSLSVKMRKFM